MTSHSSITQPPRLAASLLNLFTPPTDAESIPGDLFEEFFVLASIREASFARRWYWRQTLRSVAHLSASTLRSDPWWMAAVVVGGFCLLRLLGPLPEGVIFAVLRRYEVYENHFGIYAFFASYGIGIAHALRAFFVGSLMGMASRGREMVATLLLSLILCLMLFAAWAHSIGSHWTSMDTFVWILWQITMPLGIVIGGALVRICRSAASRRLSAN